MAALPCPVFEGSEKRLEVDFYVGKRSPAAGLRALTRPQLDDLLEQAACCIVSVTRSPHFDAYVLSESSLFVYPTKAVLKTCGTTRLLAAVPCLLALAAGLGLAPRRCKYSRASYLHPELQPELYRCFTKEAAFLDGHFGHLAGPGGSATLGEAAHGLQWHTYVADAEAAPTPVDAAPTYSLEVCMTQLCPAKAAQFARGADFVSAQHTTAAAGIASLLAGCTVDDYVFEPCGYSMNGLEGPAFATIHVTPEPGFSYASLELSGYAPDSLDASAVLAKALEVFAPGKATVSLSVNESLPACGWAASLAPPPGYSLQGAASHAFACGGCVHAYSLAADKPAAGGGRPGSPATVLDALCLTGEDSDREGTADGSSRAVSPSPCAAGDSALAGSGLPGPLAAVVRQHGAFLLPSGAPEAVEGRMAALIEARGLEDPLYVVDLGAVARLYRAWAWALPRVTPFYAVKCFTDRAVIATLAALGAGFDCASEHEMSTVLGLGVPPERIILANCCKRPRDVRAAAAFGVALTTFDTPGELAKLAAMHPGAAAVLRIRADDPDARCQLGNKYGANPEAVAPLFQAARELGVDVVGVSFHVGSAATNPAAFEEAIASADAAFAAGAAAGFDLRLLDIGGGFSSGCFSLDGPRSIPAAVARALDAHFPPERGVRIISEPGRYFTEEAATLGCMVFGTRDVTRPDGAPGREYWIPDGLYGSMNSLLYDHATLSAHPLRSSPQPLPQPPQQPQPQQQPGEAEQLLASTVFGPTCDGLDVVLKDWPLPRLEPGDWLVFPDMGAYTLAGACNFNGMGVSEANVSYVFSLAA